MTTEDVLILARATERTDFITAPKEEAAAVEIGLNAAIVSMIGGEPRILTVSLRGAPPALPFGLFTPLKHRTLEIGLRDWVRDQTGVDLGYVEQLYTFGDRGRHARPGDEGLHVVSIGYLALDSQRGGAPEQRSQMERVVCPPSLGRLARWKARNPHAGD